MSVDLKKYFRSNWQIIILSFLSIVFLFTYSWFSFVTTQDGEVRFASPDGTANYFWAQRYAQGEELFYFEELNIVANDVVVPRSVRSDNGVVKPASFLGIILIYGFLGKIFGSWIIIYLTPLFTVLGVLFFYGIVKRVFTKKIAFISALMLLALAPYWYYTSRSMFHNVLFIDLVLAGVWFWLNSTRIQQIKRIRTDFIFAFLAGIFIGLAIITRTSELIWLLPVILIAWIFYFKEIKWEKLFLFLCGIFLALMPMLYYNQVLYGGMLKFGYGASQDNLSSMSTLDNKVLDVGGGTRARSFAQDKISKFLPADINIRQAGKSFIYYYVVMFWYLFLPAFFGGIWFLFNWKKHEKKDWLYFSSFVIISVILVLYYGSWEIHDNPNKSSVTIGNSYTRYFLPMYIMSIPLAVLFFRYLAQIIKNRYLNRYLINSISVVLLLIFFTLNFQATIFAKEEGLISMKEGIEINKIRTEHIMSLVEEDAIIISERFDKFFWFDRKVITGNFTDKEHNKEYVKLIEQDVPVYYYGFIFPEIDINYLNNKRLKEFGLQIIAVELDEIDGLGLYRLQSY